MLTSFAPRCLAPLLGLAILALLATPALAQQPAPPAGIGAALAADVGEMGEKFAGLARVMAGKYDWRPGQGVRSVADVFNLIVDENKMLTALVTGAPMPRPGQSPVITDPAAMQEALKTSSATLQQALLKLSAAELNASVSMFGRQAPRQQAVMMLLFDQHEHLGQSIAYARTNGIVPPWSR